MLNLGFTVSVLLAFLTGMVSGAVSAQTYPNKPIRIQTSGLGGSNDFLSRLVAQGVTGPLGQPVIVENRAGIISLETVAKAPPDGYTLLIIGTNLWIEPLLRANVPWDPVRDFAPITLAERSPQILVVHPSLPVKSVKDLIVLAKARPGELNYGSTAVGNASHLAAELLNVMAGLKIAHIPYKGTAAAFTDLIGGQVQLVFGNPVASLPHAKSGRVRALAVTSPHPSALAPGLPTMASILPGYEAAGTTSILAPAKTPPAVISRLHQEFVRYLTSAEAKEKFLNTGLEPFGSSPEELAAIMKSEMARMGKVIREAGIRLE
jgi:tripartite-type tricarboxylate transporter receptor subunit TctC